MEWAQILMSLSPPTFVTEFSIILESLNIKLVVVVVGELLQFDCTRCNLIGCASCIYFTIRQRSAAELTIAHRKQERVAQLF